MKILVVLSALFLATVTACYSDTPKLLGLQPEAQRKTRGETQILSSKVDILFVIDDSGSMSTHQTNLTRNIDQFLDGLKKVKYLDYHIGVVSSSESDHRTLRSPTAGRLHGAVRYVNRHTPDLYKVLKENMWVGLSGENEERFFSPTYLALTEPNLSGHNKGFYRPGAFLALIFITDTDDQSDIQPGYRPRPTHPLYFKPDKFINWLYSLKSNGRNKVFTYGAAIIDIPTSVCRWGGPIPPSQHDNLKEFFLKTRGTVFSLCDADFGGKMAMIGEDLVKRATAGIILDRRPIVESIRVTYGTQEVPSNAHRGWTYDPEANTIRFGKDVEWLEQPGDPQVEIFFDPEPQ